MQTNYKLDCPPPQFQFGQPVTATCEGEKYQGTVVGMTYVSPEFAVVAGFKEFGWNYSVSAVYGKPLSELVGMADGDAQWEVFERRVEAV